MSAARTRLVVAAMRRAVATMERTYPDDTVSIELSRAYGRRRYMLTERNGLHAGSPVMFDATRGELWIRPVKGGLDELRRIRSMGRPILLPSLVTPEHAAVTLPTMVEHRGVVRYGYCVVCGLEPGNTRYAPSDCMGAWAR